MDRFELRAASSERRWSKETAYATLMYTDDRRKVHRTTIIDRRRRQDVPLLLSLSLSLPGWFSFPRSSARMTTSRYGWHNNAWRNSGVESSLPPPCNDVTGKWNSRKPGHTHIALAALSRDADRRETTFNSAPEAFPSRSHGIAREFERGGRISRTSCIFIRMRNPKRIYYSGV